MEISSSYSRPDNLYGYTLGESQHVVYRGTDGHIHELYWDGGSTWNHHDLTLATGTSGGAAAGHPTGYTLGDSQHVVYRGTDGHIHELYWEGGSTWNQHDLTLACGSSGGVAAGDPAGYTLGDSQHVVYRGTDGHIHELYWEGGSTWNHHDLTLASGTSGGIAAGDPAGYILGDSQHVVYRGTDGHIHELYWEGGSTWNHHDLTLAAGSSDWVAAGDPAGYTLGDSQHVVYRGLDSHIHELYLNPGMTWVHHDLTAGSKLGCLAVGDPAGYTLGDSQHVVYRGTDGHIYELYWDAASTWAEHDLTLASGTGETTLSLAASDPCGYRLADGQHVIYRGNDTHIYELYSDGGDWLYNDLSVASGTFHTPPSCLNGYDTVVAITQNAINNSLVNLLNQQDRNIAFYYTKNATGEYVPATNHQSADFIFTATLDYTSDDAKQAVNPVELYNPSRDSHTIRYNMTFSNGHFVSKSPPVDVEQPLAAPWILRFYVQLALQEAAIDKLPPTIRGKVEAAVKNLSSDAFSIQQLYLDLNTAVFDSYANTAGLPSTAARILAEMITAHLKKKQASAEILFGYTITAVGKSSKNLTFMPTDLNFSVSPYLDATGKHSNPGLDTLNYLIMSNNNRAPVSPPKAFGSNWMTDVESQGTIGVRRELFISFLIDKLNLLLQTRQTSSGDTIPGICRRVWVKADASKNAHDQQIQLLNADPQRLTILNPPLGYQVATLSYHSQDSSQDYFSGGRISVSADYFANCEVYLESDLVIISGSISSKAEIDISEMNSTNTTTMPLMIYRWRVSLRLEWDLEAQHNGQLNFTLVSEEYSPLEIETGQESAWEQFQRGLCGNVLEYVNTLGNISDEIKKSINGIHSDLQDAVLTNHFIFPGAQTFVFENPHFNLSLDFLSNITYLMSDCRAGTASV